MTAAAASKPNSTCVQERTEQQQKCFLQKFTQNLKFLRGWLSTYPQICKLNLKIFIQEILPYDHYTLCTVQ